MNHAAFKLPLATPKGFEIRFNAKSDKFYFSDLTRFTMMQYGIRQNAPKKVFQGADLIKTIIFDDFEEDEACTDRADMLRPLVVDKFVADARLLENSPGFVRPTAWQAELTQERAFLVDEVDNKAKNALDGKGKEQVRGAEFAETFKIARWVDDD